MTLAQHFVTVSVDLDSVCWDGSAGHGSLADAVESCIDGFLGSGAAVLSEEAVARRGQVPRTLPSPLRDRAKVPRHRVQEEEARQAASECEDDGRVRAIKEILENQVRPNIQADGGDVEFVRFDPQSGAPERRISRFADACGQRNEVLVGDRAPDAAAGRGVRLVRIEHCDCAVHDQERHLSLRRRRHRRQRGGTARRRQG